MLELANTVWLVSGYPRSGTTMMMAALRAGGMPLLCKSSRQFLELDTADYRAADFPEKYVGRLIKYTVGEQGVPHFSEKVPRLQIVFMRRDSHEIAQSMLRLNINFPPERPGRDSITNATVNLLNYFKNQARCNVVELWYKDVLADPEKAFTTIQAAGWPIDSKKAAAVVDQSQCHY